MKEQCLLHGALSSHCDYTFQVKIESNGLISFHEHRIYGSRSVGDPYGDSWLELVIPSMYFDTFLASVMKLCGLQTQTPSQRDAAQKRDEDRALPLTPKKVSVSHPLVVWHGMNIHKHDFLIELLKQLSSDGLFQMPFQREENLQVVERWLKEVGVRYRKSSSAHFHGLDPE